MKLSGKSKTFSTSLLCGAVTVQLSTAAHADFGMLMQNQYTLNQSVSSEFYLCWCCH